MNLVKFLVFSDLHIDKGYNPSPLLNVVNSMFHHKPEYVVCTGDLGDFKSLNRKVKDRKQYNTEEEIREVVKVLYENLFRPLKAYNSFKRLQHKKQYKPTIIICFGNHDKDVQGRLQVELAKICPVPLKMYKYREPVQVQGVFFCHNFEDGISGNSCTTTKQILDNVRGRSISGHQHRRAIEERRGVDGHKDFAIILPCCTVEKPEWAGQSSSKWDVGHLLLYVEPETGWYEYYFKEYHNACRV